MLSVTLGEVVKDCITEVEGVATGKCEYISGCVQVLVQPKGLTSDGKRKEAEWFDIQRLVRLNEPTVELDNYLTPGFDKLPNKR